MILFPRTMSWRSGSAASFTPAKPYSDGCRAAAPSAAAALLDAGLFLYDIHHALHWQISLGIFLFFFVLLNIKPGRQFEEWFVDVLLQSWDVLRVDFFPGLVRLLAEFFGALLEVTER